MINKKLIIEGAKPTIYISRKNKTINFQHLKCDYICQRNGWAKHKIRSGIILQVHKTKTSLLSSLNNFKPVKTYTKKKKKKKKNVKLN